MGFQATVVDEHSRAEYDVIYLTHDCSDDESGEVDGEILGEPADSPERNFIYPQSLRM